jgi:VWFA-related protein
MKIQTSKIRFVLFTSLLLCFALSFSIFAQPTLKEQNRIKDFGKSLKKYEKKNEQTNKTDTKDNETIRVETNLVVNDVLVVNQKGNLIVGLKKEDFIITENGEPQDVELFSFGEDAKVPRSIVLIIENGGIPSLVEQSIEAAKKLVDKLSPQDRMAIVSDNVKLLCDFTKDKELLKSTLDSQKKNRFGASRREYSTLLAVLNEMFDAEDIRPIVILQSSGDEVVLLKPIWEGQKKICLGGAKDWCERDFAFSDVKETVEKSRVTIYGIVPQPRILGLSPNIQIENTRLFLDKMSREIHKRDDDKKINKFINEWTETTLKENIATQSSVVDLANLSGGYTDFLEKPEDAQTVYSTIFQTIENRYVIGYYPKNETKDGKRRTVKIEVKNHPEYIVMGRKSYIAPLEEK